MSGHGAPSTIYVGIRIRPFVPREISTNEKRCVECEAGQIFLKDLQKNTQQGFALDELMDSSVEKDHKYYYNQERVYLGIGKQFYEQVREGYNAALFAYGQTGSGKTTSVVGDIAPPENRGILPRMLRDLFDHFEEQKRQGWTVDVRVRMIEIYNERINDLLAAKMGQQKKLDVRMHPKFGVYIPDLTINAVDTDDDCLNLLEYGRTMQTVAATAMNSKSSRAHTLFAMKIERQQTQKYTDIQERNEVFLVDLAGRENERTTLATGERLVELSFINKSLFHLANCIHALGAADAKAAGKKSSQAGGEAAGGYAKVTKAPTRDISVANFRNSKLTLILSEALSGNSKTFMIGTLSPAASAYDENAVTLRFAATVKNIKLSAQKISEGKTDLVASLGAEVEKLKAQLADAQAAQAVTASHSLGPRSPSMAQRMGTQSFPETEAIKELKEQLEAASAMAQEEGRSTADLKAEAERNNQERQNMLKKLGVQRIK